MKPAAMIVKHEMSVQTDDVGVVRTSDVAVQVETMPFPFVELQDSETQTKWSDDEIVSIVFFCFKVMSEMLSGLLLDRYPRNFVSSYQWDLVMV